MKDRVRFERVSRGLDGCGEVLMRVPSTSIQYYQDLIGKDCDISTDQHREKRSLSANAYAWELICQIGNTLRASKEEIYLKMLKEYGQVEMISAYSSIDISGFVKYYEVAGYGNVNGKEFTHYKVYKGSSEFDTKEMSIFIEGIVSEAKQLGLETRTPNEIANMESLWESQK